MAAFLMPGGNEIWIILIIVILLFGPTQLPKLAKMLGKSAKSIKDGIDGKLEDDAEKAKAADKAEDSEAKKVDSEDKKTDTES
jgi:sec-independent protein translocase protein TatA